MGRQNESRYLNFIREKRLGDWANATPLTGEGLIGIILAIVEDEWI
jgi:hypothetical protein